MRNTLVASDVNESCTQKWCIMRMICAVEMKMLNQISDPEDLYERLQNYWVNVGIVGALIGSMTYSTFAAPPACDDDIFKGCNFTLVGFLGFAQLMATGAGLCAAIAATVNYQYLNTVPKSMARAWTIQMLWLLPFPTIMLLLCLFWTNVAVCIFTFILYGPYVGVSGILGGGGGAMSLLAVIFYLHYKTKNFSDHAEHANSPTLSANLESTL